MTGQAMLASVFFALIAAEGCDPGFVYAPARWTPVPQYEWSHQFDGFSLRSNGLKGGVGTWWLAPTFRVFGTLNQSLFGQPRLQTADAVHEGVINPRLEAAPPGGGSLSVWWEWDQQHRLPKMLGERVVIVLDLQVGSVPQSVRIEFESSKFKRRE
jgi:hypothetical protein